MKKGKSEIIGSIWAILKGCIIVLIAFFIHGFPFGMITYVLIKEKIIVMLPVKQAIFW